MIWGLDLTDQDSKIRVVYKCRKVCVIWFWTAVRNQQRQGLIAAAAGFIQDWVLEFFMFFLKENKKKVGTWSVGRVGFQG